MKIIIGIQSQIGIGNFLYRKTKSEFSLNEQSGNRVQTLVCGSYMWIIYVW